LSEFDQTFGLFYQLIMFSIDDDILKYNDILKMSLYDFLFHTSYKIENTKRKNKKEEKK